MIYQLKTLKEFFKNLCDNLLNSLTNIDKDGCILITNHYNKINCIKQIQDSLNILLREKYLYKNISSFLFGDFIEVKFRDNMDFNYYFFKNDVISSFTLYNFFTEFEKTDRKIFKMDIPYNQEFFKLIVGYLIYNNNKDNIGTLIYNQKSWLYLKDNDDFNNNIFFNMNYFQLKQFKTYISYFKIKVLDYKVMAIIDIINLNIKSINNDKKNKKLYKFI